MKIAFTSILCLLFFCIHAQDLSLNKTEYNIVAEEYIDLGEIVVTNNGENNVNLAITLEPACLEAEDATAIQICVGIFCFTPVSVTTTWGVTTNPDDILISLDPGESNASLKFDPFFDSEDYGSEWNLILFEIDNPDNKATLNVKLGGECTPVGTQDLIELQKTAFPNPTSDRITISYDEFVSAETCSIYNSLGTLQESIALNRSNTTLLLDVSDYADGIYFYQFTNEGEASRTKTFVKY